ncbi:DNA-3-methyladenine glycosylase II [Fulvivirga imtechensis AK7]|uniref:DNA-3-methyladenine glycosylase II n=1 Tax=Fulvivirga imtechensis AK7 TaxID=1237149 RepID=L8JXL0_9BACT|nr:DNA-3-methyladenine glycosylase [Fulvivirga imtechensis]ELR72918.1 DNA-3-methyladenine glycosylase II [Fulvivirga imtechensis AK7]
MEVTISKPAYFDYAQCLRYVDRGFDECLYHVKDDIITKTISINNERAVIQIAEAGSTLNVKTLTDSTLDPDQFSLYVRSWFDMDRDLSGFYNLFDPLLTPLLRQYQGLRLVGIENLYEALCWSIIGQQINLAFAFRLKRAMVEKYGMRFDHEGHSYYFFPSPEALASATREDLLELQFSRQKADYIINLSQKFAEKLISKEELQQLSLAEAVQVLSELKGIGPWTANYVAMRCLKFMDAFPMGDAGLQNAIKYLQGREDKPSMSELAELSEKWQGWQAYATLFLWRSLSKD